MDLYNHTHKINIDIMKITKFNEFHNNDDEWLSKYALPSDNIRYRYIQIAKSSEPSDEIVNYRKLTDIWDGYDDLVFVRNRDTHIDFYEGFVDSCWVELYKKPGYYKLSRTDAIDKLINDRFKKIANDLNLTIAEYTFDKRVLYVKFEPLT